MELRKAVKGEEHIAMSIIDEARAFQLSYGNAQWGDGYPSLSLIEKDIEEGIGYFMITDEIAGYLAIVDYDPSYDDIEGEWLTDGKYLALHRIAFSNNTRGKGLFQSLIANIKILAEEKGAEAIRIDTDRRNPIMLHLLPKVGFEFTGYVLFAGDKKLAYELPLGAKRNLP